MKKHSKFFQIFLIFTSFLFVMFLSCNNVKAQYYEKSENKVVGYTIDKDNNSLTVSIQFQNGVTEVSAYICNDAGCTSEQALTVFKHNETEYSKVHINTNETSVIRDFIFNSNAEGIPLNSYSDKVTNEGKVNNEYEIVIEARFCIVRSKDDQKCNTFDSDTATVLVRKNFILKGGITNYGEINSTIGQILIIINNIVIPVLWLALGILLIARGILLGIGIIKSSDEPEVRQKKVHGLIWLGIGIGVAYIITIGASAIMSMLGYGGYF